MFSEHSEFGKLVPNSYQDTLAYRLCTLTSGCGALYIIGLTYYVREHSSVHGIPAVFTPIWAGIFLLCSSLFTIALHNNRSKFRLIGVLVILLVTMVTCAFGAFTTAFGSQYFVSQSCQIVPDHVKKSEMECVCLMGGLYNSAANKVTIDTVSLGYCRNKIGVLKGLMMVTSMVCLMTIAFLFMQLLVLLVQIKSSTSLAEISNALVSGAGDDISGKYSGLESGAANYEELKEQSTKLVK